MKESFPLRRLLTLFSPLFLLLAVGLPSGMAPTLSAAHYEPLPSQLDGSMMPYDFSKEDSLPSFPGGYRPIGVSYVARHGARFLSSPKKVAKIEKALYDAALEGRLSAEGDAFFSLLKQIADSTGSDWGLLSPVGIMEEKRLGQQMSSQLSALFGKGEVYTISTFVPRVIMTMYQFNHALERGHERLSISTLSGHCNDSLLYSFDFYPEVDRYRTDGAWKEAYDKFVEDFVSPAPAERLFNATSLDERKLRDLTMELYGVLQGCRAAGFAPPTTRWISPEEYFQCWRASNMKHYLRNTPNPLNPYSAAATSPLIRRMIKDADAVIAAASDSLGNGERRVLNGYFGHAETLLPLFSTLGLPGCFAYTSDYDTLDSEWQLQTITPLGANLEIIFLSPEGKEISPETMLTAIRLNGRNVPAYPDAPMFISWAELRTHWLERIAALTPASE